MVPKNIRDENWENQINNWLKEFQIEIDDLELIKDALTHSSYKGMGYNVKDNERLEFLGDAVLDLVLAKQLFKNSNLTEGDMTKIRERFVNNDFLSTAYKVLKMDKIVLTANNLEISNKIAAGFVEALFGAIYLNQGFESCNILWNRLKSEYKVDELFLSFYIDDPKGTLIAFFQKRGLNLPEFKTEKIGGPDHMPTFQCTIIVKYEDVEYIAEENYLNKKGAEKYAAISILKQLGETYPFDIETNLNSFKEESSLVPTESSYLNKIELNRIDNPKEMRNLSELKDETYKDYAKRKAKGGLYSMLLLLNARINELKISVFHTQLDHQELIFMNLQLGKDNFYKIALGSSKSKAKEIAAVKIIKSSNLYDWLEKIDEKGKNS